MIHIRPAREIDAALLAAIGLRAWATATAMIGVTEPLKENARMAFTDFAQSAWQSITLVETGEAIAGWAARENYDDTISDFWIDPIYQRQGIGTALLADIERQIVERNFPSAQLESHAQNEQAVSFFRKHGYGVSWFSMKYSERLDREVQSIGLQKEFVVMETGGYGFGF